MIDAVYSTANVINNLFGCRCCGSLSVSFSDCLELFLKQKNGWANEIELLRESAYSSQNFEPRASTISLISLFTLSNLHFLVFIHILSFFFRNSVRLAHVKILRKTKMSLARWRRSWKMKLRLHLHQILSIRSFPSKFCMIIFFSLHLSLFFSSTSLFLLANTPFFNLTPPPQCIGLSDANPFLFLFILLPYMNYLFKNGLEKIETRIMNFNKYFYSPSRLRNFHRDLLPLNHSRRPLGN